MYKLVVILSAGFMLFSFLLWLCDWDVFDSDSTRQHSFSLVEDNSHQLY